MKDHTFVFVAGLHRSGTSILFKSLRDHPEISGFEKTGSPEDEGQHLQTVFAAAKKYGGAGRFGFDPASHLDETSVLATEENARKLFSEWGRHWDQAKPCLLEKSPPNLVRTRFLQALFPNSYFVVLTRHPVATAFAEHKYKRDLSIRHLLEHWLVTHERFDSDRKQLRNVRVVKYEDFVASPERSLNLIFSDLGIEKIPATRKVLATVNEKYLGRWHTFRRGLFTRGRAGRMVKDYGERVRRFGYDMDAVEQLRPYPGEG
jgi:hypothetical protein